MSGIVAVIPIRSFREGKSRLASYLSPEERSSLIRTMFEHVVDAARQSGVIGVIVVISPDDAVLDYAATLGPDVLPVAQSADEPGLNAAVALGREVALGMQANGMLVLFGDLPLIVADDVRNLVRRDAPLVIATDRHGSGTNALMLRLGSEAARTFSFHYGMSSRQRHIEEADQLGIDAVTAIAAGTANDLDTIDDLERLTANGRSLPGWLRIVASSPQEKSA